MDWQQTTLFGLSAVGVVYWLTQHARRVGLIKDPRVAFLCPGAAWTLLVALNAFAPQAAVLLLTALGGWVATLLFKAGAKDNERKDG